MEELNKNIDKFNFTFDIDSIIQFVIINYKQLLLLFLVFVIIYIVDCVSFHNSIIYGVATNLPGTVLPDINIKTKNKKQKIKNKK
jgi:hypothetical protein